MRAQSAPETVCDLLRRSRATLAVAGTDVPAVAYAEAARRYGRGFAEQGYPDRSLILLSVRRPHDVLALTFGAWWAGHHVAFAAEPSHGARDELAVRIGAALQVCDPDDIVDEEHIRHRDVPAVEPAEVASVPSSWPALCRPGDTALVTWRNVPRDTVASTHADVMAAAAKRATGVGDVVTVPPGTTGRALVDAAVLALVVEGRLRT